MKKFVLALLLVAYWIAGRRWVLEWGATDDEARSVLPGDELIPDADGRSTRAITVNATADKIWPWIAQMGPAPRGGAYTYDWIENLFGLNMHSADEVLPEFQNPQLGDEIGYGPNKMRIELVDHDRALVWRSADGNWVWAFALREDGGRTRLISRNSFRLNRTIDKLGMLPMEPGSLVMERKMLLGMKQRAERLGRSET